MNVEAAGARQDSASVHTGLGARRWSSVFRWSCLIATPFIQLFFNPNLFVTQAENWLDPWVYTGYFVSFPSHLRMFGDTYYATRLCWLLPGFVAHRMFSPLIANYVLHLSFFYVLLFATYRLVSTAVNEHAGMLAALMIGWNPMILAALSWDYVDGAGIVFIVVSLMCLEKHSQTRNKRFLWALAAGAAMAAMICSNLFLVVLWPVLAVFLFMRVGFDRWRFAVVSLIVAAAGAATLLLALAFVNVRLGGDWLFLKASFRQSSAMLTIPNIWRIPGYTWLGQAQWLVLPAVATVGAVFSFVRRGRTLLPFERSIHLALLLSVMLWLLLQLRGLPVLQVYYYASYLVPFSLLALLLQSPWLGNTSDRDRLIIELGIFTLFIAAHWLILSDVGDFWLWVVRRFQPILSREIVATSVGVTAGLLAIVSARFVRREHASWVLFAVCLTISYLACSWNWPSAHNVRTRPQFEQTVTAHRFIRDNIGGRRPKVWYHAKPDTQLPFIAIASTYLWGYVVINQDLPLLSAEQAATLTVDSPLVLLVPTGQGAEIARPALRNFGFDYTLETQKTFGNGDLSFTVMIAKLIRTGQIAAR